MNRTPEPRLRGMWHYDPSGDTGTAHACWSGGCAEVRTVRYVNEVTGYLRYACAQHGPEKCRVRETTVQKAEPQRARLAQTRTEEVHGPSGTYTRTVAGVPVRVEPQPEPPEALEGAAALHARAAVRRAYARGVADGRRLEREGHR